jgi:GNAT superfamily N-acetyltransferase
MSIDAPAWLPQTFELPMDDGQLNPVEVRLIRPGDAEAIETGFQNLSNDTKYYRFFSACSILPYKNLEKHIQARDRNEAALVAMLGNKAIGVANYAPTPGEPNAVEAAIVLADRAQRRQGLGSFMMRSLFDIARARGNTKVAIEYLTVNRPIINLIDKVCGPCPIEQINSGTTARRVYALDQLAYQN